MENASVLDTGRIIDSASMLFGNQPQAPGRAQTAQHTEAMARRLEQLQAAMGHGETPPEQAPAASSPTPPAPGRHGFNATTLVMAAIVAALAGTALMSLTAQSKPLPDRPAATLPMPLPAAVAAPAADPSAGQPAISDEKQVGERLESWRRAWVQRDVASYLNAYSRDFLPADGSSRDSWVLARTKKLSSAASIDVQIGNLAIERIDERQLKASFRQDYASGSYRETARPKSLLFAREADGWKIIKEWQEAAPLEK